jgi:hypothetical protein
MCHGIYFIKGKNPSLQKFLTIINAYTWQKVDIIEIPLQDHLANLKCISNGPSLHVQDKNIKIIKSSNLTILFIPLLPEGGAGYTVLPLSVCPSFRPSKIFFVAFLSVTVDGRNLIFG